MNFLSTFLPSVSEPHQDQGTLKGEVKVNGAPTKFNRKD